MYAQYSAERQAQEAKAKKEFNYGQGLTDGTAVAAPVVAPPVAPTPPPAKKKKSRRPTGVYSER